MKKRGLVIGLLIMLAVITSGFTYAFWANGVLGNSDTAVGTINISEGQDVATTVNVADVTAGKELVPAGFVVNTETQTASADLQFSVAWTTAATDALDGTTSVGDIVITSSVKFFIWDGTAYVEVLSTDENFALIASKIAVTPNVGNATTITLGAAATTINYSVTLLEPANQAEYDFFANGKIEVTFTFTVNNVETTDN